MAQQQEYVRTRRVSRTERARKTAEKKRSVWGWVFAICIAVIVAFLVRAFLFEIIKVDGPSMQPTLHTDERVAVEKVTRYSGLPQRGDIIIVHYPDGTDKNYVKRVIGLPGETIEVKNSMVYINGQAFEEDYVSPEPYGDILPAFVPENTVYVMGDNRANSMDSRLVGPIGHDQIVGHAMATIYPFNQMRQLN